MKKLFLYKSFKKRKTFYKTFLEKLWKNQEFLKNSPHTIFVCWKKIGRKSFFRYCTRYQFPKKMFYIEY